MPIEGSSRYRTQFVVVGWPRWKTFFQTLMLPESAMVDSEQSHKRKLGAAAASADPPPQRLIPSQEFAISSLGMFALLARWSGKLQGQAAAAALVLLRGLVRLAFVHDTDTVHTWWLQRELPSGTDGGGTAASLAPMAVSPRPLPVTIVGGMVDITDLQAAVSGNMMRTLRRTRWGF